MDGRNYLPKIETANLFRELDEKLIALLSEISADEWSAFATPKWTVKDVAAHLLDGNIRRLSMCRDGFFGETFAGSSYEELTTFLNGLNADWVKAMRRVGPKVLIEFLRQTGSELAAYFESLDPEGEAPFPVAWAGETSSRNWFDIAREYTEKWHHQQQIRDAVGKPGIMERKFYQPVLATFMRALPHTYRDLEAESGTTIKVTVDGDAGGTWFLARDRGWQLTESSCAKIAAEIKIPSEHAWKLFTRGLSESAFATLVTIRGDEQLGRIISRATAIMA